MVLTDLSSNEIMPPFFPEHLLQAPKPTPTRPLPNHLSTRQLYYTKNLARKRPNTHFQLFMTK